MSGRLGLIVLCLRGAFRPLIRARLRVADGLRQHQAQFVLRFRRLPRDRCFPLCHESLYGVPERELNPIIGGIAQPRAPVLIAGTVPSVSQHPFQPGVNRTNGRRQKTGERSEGFYQFLNPACPSAHDFRPHMLTQHPRQPDRHGARAA